MGDHFTHQKGREALIYLSEHGLLEEYRRATGPPPAPLALAYSWVQSHKLSAAAQGRVEGQVGIELPKGPNPTHKHFAPRDGDHKYHQYPLALGGRHFAAEDLGGTGRLLDCLPARERKATRFITSQLERLKHIKWLRRRGNVLVHTFSVRLFNWEGEFLEGARTNSWEGEVLEDLDQSLAHVSKVYTYSRERYATTWRQNGWGKNPWGLAHVPELRVDHFEHFNTKLVGLLVAQTSQAKKRKRTETI